MTTPKTPDKCLRVEFEPGIQVFERWFKTVGVLPDAASEMSIAGRHLLLTQPLS